MNTESSAVFRMEELEYPKLGPALVEAAVMGYGVIAYDKGYFYLAWWNGDEPMTPILTWARCDTCDSLHHGESDCHNCVVQVEVA